MEAVLSIAGSDSSGGAGIQADIKTIAAHRLFAETAVTALTAQNTLGVTDVLDVDPAFVSQQIDAVFEDIRPAAVKVGMVSSAAIIEAVADALERARHDDAPAFEDGDVRAELLELGQVVRGVDDGCTLVGELADRAQDLAARLHVRADGRLVHEDQARAVHDRHARVEPALLPARQVRGSLASFLCEAEEVHHLARARGRLTSSEPVQFAEGREVLGDSQIRVDAELLGRVPDQARGLDGGGAVPADAGASGVGLAQPAQNRDERGLAGPVSSEQSEDLAGFDAQVDPSQDLVSSVALADPPSLQGWGVWM